MRIKLKFVYPLIALAYFLILALLTVAELYNYTYDIPPIKKFIYIFVVLAPTIASIITALITSQISDNRYCRHSSAQQAEEEE